MLLKFQVIRVCFQREASAILVGKWNKKKQRKNSNNKRYNDAKKLTKQLLVMTTSVNVLQRVTLHMIRKCCMPWH